MNILKKILFVGAVLVFSSAFSQANLVVNGGFENAPAQGSGNDPKGVNFGGTAYYANSVPVGPLNGWSFGYDGTLDNYGGTAEIEWFSTTLKKSWNAAPAEGNFALELNSDAFRGRIYAQASLTQNLSVGQTYTMAFDLAPEAGVKSPAQVTAAVMIDGKEYDFTVPASSSATSTWTHESFSFVATSATPVVRIYDGIYQPDVNTNFYNDINLDNITIDPPQVPEPSSLFTLAALFVMMGGQWGWKKAVSHRQPC